MNKKPSNGLLAAIGAGLLVALTIAIKFLKKAPRAVISGGGMKKRTVAVFALLAVFIGGWEGLRNQAYQDVGGVWTVCYGETRGVKRGDKYTNEECEAMLGRAVAEFAEGVDACVPNHASLPDKTYSAFVSLAYNIGRGAFCSSTLVRKAVSGDLRGACDEILRWDKVKGRVVRGLTNRRKAEHEMCVAGLNNA